MASFDKRGKRWRARIRRRGYPEQVDTFPTKYEAQTWARQIEGRMDAGTWRDQREGQRTTLRDALDRYERDVLTPREKRTGKDQTKERSRVRLWKRSKLADAFLTSIRGGDLAEWRDARLEAGVTGGTVLRDMALIQRLYNVARKEWKMEGLVNPVDDVAKPTAGQGRQQRVSAEEEAALLAAADNAEVAALVILAVETAMRRGELLALRWEHIDWTRHTAHLPDTKNYDARTVPLSPRAIDTLTPLPRPISGKGPVFRTTIDVLVFAWRRTRQRAQLEHIRFHDLRHEATSRLVESGRYSVLEIAAITGHRDMKMLRRYTHPRAEELARRMRP